MRKKLQPYSCQQHHTILIATTIDSSFLPPSLADFEQPVELWTGKQLFGVLVRPNARTRVFVTLGCAERNYSKSGEEMCVRDGFVRFRNSELISGQLGKATLGKYGHKFPAKPQALQPYTQQAQEHHSTPRSP